MLVVETIAKIRRLSLVHGKSIKAICRELKVSRKVVRKVLRSGETEFRYERKHQPYPRMDAWRDELDRLLSANASKSQRERLTLIRVFEELRGLGYWQLQLGVATCTELGGAARQRLCRGLHSVELCAGRSLPVRLEP